MLRKLIVHGRYTGLSDVIVSATMLIVVIIMLVIFGCELWDSNQRDQDFYQMSIQHAPLNYSGQELDHIIDHYQSMSLIGWVLTSLLVACLGAMLLYCMSALAGCIQFIYLTGRRRFKFNRKGSTL